MYWCQSCREFSFGCSNEEMYNLHCGSVLRDDCYRCEAEILATEWLGVGIVDKSLVDIVFDTDLILPGCHFEDISDLV